MQRQKSDPSESRRAQHIQFAARKLARENEQNKIFQTQEIQRQLEEAEVKRGEIETRGVEIEKDLELSIHSSKLSMTFALSKLFLFQTLVITMFYSRDTHLIYYHPSSIYSIH